MPGLEAQLCGDRKDRGDLGVQRPVLGRVVPLMPAYSADSFGEAIAATALP